MDALDREIAAFERDREMLDTHHVGKWVIYHDQKLFGVYDEFETAANTATQQFGREIFLLRQVGAPPLILPASVLYSLV